MHTSYNGGATVVFPSGTTPYKTATWLGQDGEFSIRGIKSYTSTYYPYDYSYIGTITQSSKTISVAGDYVGYIVVHQGGESVMGGGQVLFE